MDSTQEVLTHEQFEHFGSSLRRSFALTNRRYWLLLKSLAAAFYYFSGYYILLFILLAPVAVQHGAVRAAFAVIALLYLVYFTAKANGALGLVLGKIAAGETDIFGIGKSSVRDGAKFFVNGLRTGLIFLFGQMVMVCACFLIQSNMIFSPYLMLYEGVTGKRAKQRSVELARGFGWEILGRSVIVMLIGYLTFIFCAVLLFTPYFVIGFVLLIFVNLYFGLLQAHFIRNVYENVLRLQGTEHAYSARGRTKAIALVGVMAIVIVYVLIHYIRR